ncbi:MAG TPA: WD40 repeat domain-containing protein [Urbifossiella sp.]|nr:WD40 repeat domain-containing protein [Urbifossiella sp.]
MPVAVCRIAAFALLFSSLAAFAQPAKKSEPKVAPAKLPEPTAAEIDALAAKFKAERDAAIKARFPQQAMAKADDLAKRAATAQADGNPRRAARYYRDARWQLPYLPVDLPPHVTRVLGESRMRHSDRVNSVAYSPDGGRLASASRDGTVKIWDLSNGRELVTYRGHADQPNDRSANANVLSVGGVAFHPKGKMVASVGGTQLHLWEADTGKRIKVLATIEKSDKPLKCVAFSPDGKSIAVGCDDGILRAFETETGKGTYTSPVRNGARIERVAFSPNGKLIGIADNAGNAAVYAPLAANQMPMSTGVIDQTGACLGVAFTADNRSIFTCGYDARARLTHATEPDGKPNALTASRVREFVGHTGSVNDLAVPSEGNLLITGGQDHTVRVWDATTAKQLRSFQGHMDEVVAVAVRSDARQIASASIDGAIRLWDMSPSDDHRALVEATQPIWAVAVSPDGKRAAAAGGDKMIRVYDPETGRLEATLAGNKAAVTTIAFFPDGNRLASGGGDRTVRIWDVAAKKAVKEMPGHELPILGVALTSDGKKIVSVSADGTARGWDATTGDALWNWSGRSKALCTVSIRAGDAQVALGAADGTLVVLDVSGSVPKEVATLTAHSAGVAAAAYSPDGSKLATAGGDGALRIWTIAETGQPVALKKFEGQVKPGSPSGFSPLSGVAFSADGRFVASAGADAVVRVWDVQTQAEVRGLRGHTEWATCVAFSPDARLLLSGGADKIARIFELAPQEGAGGLGHLLTVNAIAVSPDGKLAATASADHTVKIWELATGRELATLIGSSDEIPLSVSFLGNDRVVVGSDSHKHDKGFLNIWSVQPPRLLHTSTMGRVFNVLGAADGSKAAAWSVRFGNNETDIHSYELLDKAGKSLVAFPDPGHKISAASFSADLTWAAVGDDQGVVRILDLNKKERIGSDWPLFDKFAVGDLGLTPDKKLLVAIDQGGRVKIADVAKRAVLPTKEIVAHKGPIGGLIVSPKGDTFLTLGGDREVKAWSLADPSAPREIRSWKLPVGVKGAAYTPDGRSIVTANLDGTAYVLELK